MTATTNGKNITKSDLEAAFSKFLGDGETAVKEAAPKGIAIASAIALGIIAIAYGLGKRKGRVRSAVVEIRKK
jgi:hypothetical protein